MGTHWLRKLLLIALCALPVVACSAGEKVIAREDLVSMFQNIGRDTSWDMSKPKLWGYFFTDPDRAKLEKVVPLLERQGYRFVTIFVPDKEDPDEADIWWLHVEKIEVHTPDSLHARNQDLYKFARSHHLGSYDGMDVGPVEGR